jgi:hypothetical protein
MSALPRHECFPWFLKETFPVGTWCAELNKVIHWRSMVQCIMRDGTLCSNDGGDGAKLKKKVGRSSVIGQQLQRL